MNKNIISLLVAATILPSYSMAQDSQKKLVFYRTAAEYKETKMISDINDASFNIDLIDTAVLDSFNVVIKKDDNIILPSSIEIHKKSEENILKLNKGNRILINGKSYILESNGNGFIKLRNENGMTTYIPKEKIEEISFEKDISSINHIAKINLRDDVKNIEVDFHYMLGLLSWKPSYKFYIKDKHTLELDYFIEVDNKTLNTFENIKMDVVMGDSPDLINNSYTSSEQGGVFDYTKNIKLSGDTKLFKLNGSEYNQKGFSREGFNQNGFYYESEKYSQPTKRIEENLELFSLPNKITLTAKAISKHLYLDNQEIAYERKNEMNLPKNVSINDDDLFYRVQTRLYIPNKENISYKRGIGSLYSKEKSDFNKVLIKEYQVNNENRLSGFNLNLGDNVGLDMELTSTDDIYKASDIFVFHDKDEMIDKKNTIEKGYQSEDSIYKTGADFYIKRIEFKAHNRSNEDNLKIQSQYYQNNKEQLIDIKNIEKIKKLISQYNSLDTALKTEHRLDAMIEEIKEKYTLKEMSYSLSETSDIVYYLFKYSETFIDLNDFSKDGFYDKDSLKEKTEEFDLYISNI